MPISLVVQTFIKADTLTNLLRSLSRCWDRGSVNLILWSDSPTGARSETNPVAVNKEAVYTPKNEEVMTILEDFAASQGSAFSDVVLRRNDRNVGCYGTCQLAMDLALEMAEFAILVEDDVVFSVDALTWFLKMQESGVLDQDDCWAITGESIYFDARDKQPTEDHVSQAKRASIRRGYFNKYTPLNFVPSTCFATRRDKWKLFREVRGRPLGDVELCKLCAETRKCCVFPILPRIKDVGMLHPDGYSVGIHGVAGVQQINNTYLMSEDLLDAVSPSGVFEPFPSTEQGSLYRESVLLEGFGRDA